MSFEISPSFEFRDTGRHVVTLQATSSNGCLDTVSQVVDVIPLADVFFPNAFTPNNNGRNEVFKGVGNVNLINDYSMNIYDRWGKVVFATNDPNEGWNGRLQNSGELLPMGVYMYLASYRVPRGDMKERRGFATLVR
ncbi:MAG: gliding motility-associated C-terminal domain-containing protein [Bacteroidota bacterium]